MISKKNYFFLLVVFSTIHTSISESERDQNHDSFVQQCPCSHSSKSHTNDKEYLISESRAEKILRDILLWLHSAKIKPQKSTTVKRGNGFLNNLQITSRNDQEESLGLLNELVLGKIELNNVEKESRTLKDKSKNQVSKHSQKTSLKNPKLRYHFAPSRQFVSRGVNNKLDNKIGIYLKKDVKPELLLPLNKNHKQYTQFDIVVPPQKMVPSEEDKLISHKINTQKHFSKTIPAKALTDNILSKNDHLDYIPPFLTISDRDGLIPLVSSNKHQNQDVEPLQVDDDETIAYGSDSYNDLIMKFMNNKVQHNDITMPQDVTNEGFHQIQDLNPDPIFINPEVVDDKESKHILLNDKSNTLRVERNQIPVYKKHGKSKYITRSNYVSDLESEAIPQVTNIKVISDEATPEGQKTFRSWILNQITKLNNLKKDGQDEIDLEDVENSLLRILSQNDISVTAEGMLMGSDGSILDFHTLNLMPILVQDSVYLERQMEENAGATNLQDILVTATHPSKILGILTVKKNYLPLSVVSGTERVHRTKKRDLDNIDELDNGENIDQLFTNYLSKLNAGYSNNKEFNGFEEEKNDVGRIFLPNLEPEVEIFSDRQYMPVAISRQEPQGSDEIDVLKMVQKFLIDLENGNESGVKDSRNAVAIEVPDPFITSRGLPFGLDSDSKTVMKLGLVDMSSGLKDFYKMGKRLGANQKLGINVPLTSRMQGVRFSKTGPLLRVNSMPLNDLDSVSLTENRNVPDIFTTYESEILSRSDTLPEVLAENNSNGVDSPDVLLENEDDDDDGDFRIIGGNAATGSGTPLSNRGRSGRNF